MNRELDDKFYLLKEHEGQENKNDYCSNVLETVQKSQIGNDSEIGNENVQENFELNEQKHFKLCLMDSVKDSSCKATFYHNDIEGDQHFKKDAGETPVGV